MSVQKKTALCIPVDRCLDGDPILFEENIDPKVLDLSEKDEIVPVSPVSVQGKVYRAQEWLIVSASIAVQIRVPCSTCNEDVVLDIKLPSFFHQEQLDTIKGGFWDMSTVVREAILLEVPFFVHCGGETCKHFDDLKKYFREPSEVQDLSSHQPFRDLL